MQHSGKGRAEAAGDDGVAVSCHLLLQCRLHLTEVSHAAIQLACGIASMCVVAIQQEVRASASY